MHFWSNQWLSWHQMYRLIHIQIVWSSYLLLWRTSQWALQSSLASLRVTCQIGVRLGRWQVVLNMEEWVFILFSCNNNCHHSTHLPLWRPTSPRLAEILVAAQFYYQLSSFCSALIILLVFRTLCERFLYALVVPRWW